MNSNILHKIRMYIFKEYFFRIITKNKVSGEVKTFFTKLILNLTSKLFHLKKYG
jgi:hypothetical protein